MKPILFNTGMTWSIMIGRKTCTRRAVKPAPTGDIRFEDGYLNEYADGAVWWQWKPPYSPGDILYVREAWAAWSKCEGITPRIVYRADGESLPGVKWRPSIHMPKAIARTFLRVTDVGAERLQDITYDDIVKEGICTKGDVIKYKQRAVQSFRDVWDRTIKPADLVLYEWNANPWVWVIRFERISKAEAEG